MFVFVELKGKVNVAKVDATENSELVYSEGAHVVIGTILIHTMGV